MAEYIIDDDFLDDEAKLSADVNGYLYELIRCKDCIKKKLCMIYRETNDEYGYCFLAEKRTE